MNFLFPQKLAELADDRKIKQLENKIRNNKQKEINEQKKLDNLLNKISKLKITISAKANNEGNLFGGISADQLSKILQEKHGIQIDASKIELKQNIKTLGEHKVAIKLGQESETFLLVNVVEDTDKKK